MPNSGVPFWLDIGINPDPYDAKRNPDGAYTVAPDPWSIVLMGLTLVPLPGLLENGDIRWRRHPHRNIDKGKKTATDGANPKLQGYGVAEFDLPLVIWTPSQLAQLYQMLPVLWPGKSSPITTSSPPGVAVAPGNGIPGAVGTVGLNLTQVVSGGGSRGTAQGDKPLLIQHPALTLVGIGQVLVEGFTPPIRYQGKNDQKVYVIHCLEFRPGQAKQTTTPKLIGTTPINARTLPPQGATIPPSQTGAGPSPSL